jgi:hypothetical protein
MSLLLLAAPLMLPRHSCVLLLLLLQLLCAAVANVDGDCRDAKAKPSRLMLLLLRVLLPLLSASVWKSWRDCWMRPQAPNSTAGTPYTDTVRHQ